MNKKISGTAYNITIDEAYSRFFLLSERSVRVFDLYTNEKIVTLRDLAHPEQIFLSKRNNIIVVASTIGGFVFYSMNDLTFLGKVQIKGEPSTGRGYYFDEEENALYGIAYGYQNKYQVLWRVSVENLEYEIISLLPQKNEGVKVDKPITSYTLHKYSQGNYYLICDFYDVGKKARIYECFYGRYEKENNTLVLKEKYFSTNEYHMTLFHITEPEGYRRFLEYCKAHRIKCHTVGLNSYRKGRDLFFITDEAIYRDCGEGNFEEVYRSKYMSDYAEFGDRRYICTWEWCLIQEVEKVQKPIVQESIINKKIKICACDIFFDYEMNRFFLITARGVKAFDLATNQRIASFSDVANPNQVAFSKKHNLMIIKSTGGNFAVYKRDDFTLLGKVKFRGCSNTDAEFIYDEEENALYGIMTVGLENQLYRVFPQDLKCETFKFPKEIEGFEEFKKVSAHYRLHRYKDGGFYILRNVRGENDLKGKRSGERLGEAGTLKKVMSLLGKNLLTMSKRMDSEELEREDTEKLIDKVFEGVLPVLEEAENNIYKDEDKLNDSSFREYSYGIYRLENDKLILKEKLMTSSELMTLEDIDYPNAAKEIRGFCGKSSGYFRKVYKSRNKLFFVTSEGIYEKTDKEIKEVYNDEYMSDFAEYNGKQYICTWEYCLIRDIPEEE